MIFEHTYIYFKIIIKLFIFFFVFLSTHGESQWLSKFIDWGKEFEKAFD